MSDPESIELHLEEPSGLAETIRQLEHDATEGNVRVFYRDDLVYASYDRGRTQVVRPSEEEEILHILQQALA